jgi:hypothetical protein
MTLHFDWPSGVLYAGLISTGWSLQRQESFITGHVRAGKLRNSGDLHLLAEKA